MLTNCKDGGCKRDGHETQTETFRDPQTEGEILQTVKYPGPRGFLALGGAEGTVPRNAKRVSGYEYFKDGKRKERTRLAHKTLTRLV